MTVAPTYEDLVRAAQAAWKSRTRSLPDEARLPAPYFRDGQAVGSYPHCLPREFAAYNLLPDVREAALRYFATEGIHWHAALDGGPTNHLLSSQIQCVNALTPMLRDGDEAIDAFGSVLPIGAPLRIEGHHYLAFEYIGAVDHLGEAKPGIPRSRGAYCTSTDAAIRYRRPDGGMEIALIEWKFTESYDGSPLGQTSTDRFERYRDLAHGPHSPLRFDVVPYEDLFVEPYYQLMRQQLLAAEMERTHELGADVVRVVHVAPAGNTAYKASLSRDSHRAAGDSVYDVWRSVLRDQSRFVTLDSEIFCDPRITSAEYVDRYGIGTEKGDGA
jgi:hypothetical protein